MIKVDPRLIVGARVRGNCAHGYGYTLKDTDWVILHIFNRINPIQRQPGSNPDIIIAPYPGTKGHTGVMFYTMNELVHYYTTEYMMNYFGRTDNRHCIYDVCSCHFDFIDLTPIAGKCTNRTMISLLKR